MLGTMLGGLTLWTQNLGVYGGRMCCLQVWKVPADMCIPDVSFQVCLQNSSHSHTACIADTWILNVSWNILSGPIFRDLNVVENPVYTGQWTISFFSPWLMQSMHGMRLYLKQGLLYWRTTLTDWLGVKCDVLQKKCNRRRSESYTKIAKLSLSQQKNSKKGKGGP